MSGTENKKVYSTMTLWQQKMEYYDIYYNSGLTVDLDRGIKVTLPPEQEFNVVDEFMLSTIIVNQEWENKERPNAKIYLAQKSHPAYFVSDMLGISVKSFMAGEGTLPGGWVRELPIFNLKREIEIDLPRPAGSYNHEIVCAYEDTSLNLWLPFKMCEK